MWVLKYDCNLYYRMTRVLEYEGAIHTFELRLFHGSSCTSITSASDDSVKTSADVNDNVTVATPVDS